MASLFRRPASSRITSLFREVFSEIALSNPEATLDVSIVAAAQAIGMVEYDVEAIAERLLAMADKAKANSAKKKPSGPRKEGSGFGSGFNKWVTGLDTDKLCLWLADYDFQKADYLFRSVDIDDLPMMATMKTEQTWQGMRAQFEACVIGFGGKLEGQSDATVYEVDMNDTKSIDDMVSQMKALGF